MKPVWQDSHGALWQGHVLDVLAALPAQSVQCVVTSPPYWGLRAYGTDPQVWGDRNGCDHTLESSGPSRPPRLHHGQGATTLHETGPHGTQPHGTQRTPKLDEQWTAWESSTPGKVITGGTGAASAKQVSNAGSQYGNGHRMVGNNSAIRGPAGMGKVHGGLKAAADGDQRPVASGQTCTRCGAWRCELGSEPTVAQFIANLVEVFRGVWRVLRDDGTLWVNLGSSYSGGGGFDPNAPSNRNGSMQSAHVGTTQYKGRKPANGYKPKDLILTPFLLAEALRQDGWYLRSAITLCKVAPMPESVTDRPTSATEMLFLLSKQERYFYDPDAVRQPHIAAHLQRQLAPNADRGDSKQFGKQGLHDYLHPMGANLKNWWEWRPEPSRVAHYAAFPTHIPRRAILAGTSERGGCPACGAPWQRRVLAKGPDGRTAEMRGGKAYDPNGRPLMGDNMIDHGVRGSWNSGGHVLERSTLGWAPTCACDAGDPVPQIVLDPFVGSGTTVAVARALGRYGIGIDLNAEYIALARQRVQQGVLL